MKSSALVPEEEERLAWLTEGQLSGALSPEEKAELAELLDGSSAAQIRFAALVEFETALTEAHRAPVFSIQHAGRRAWLARDTMLPWLIAAACLVIACLALIFQASDRNPEKLSAPAAVPAEMTALILNEVDAKFATLRRSDATGLDPGSYHLQQGTIHLRFSNGAELVMQGPARFEIIDAFHSRFEYGELRAIVPPAAKGFTIQTEQAHFEDVGTEFGLRVEQESGAASLLVIDGQVHVRDPKTGDVLHRLTSGQVYRSKNEILARPPHLDPETFPVPGAISHKRWLDDKAGRLQDPGLLALFTFEQDPQAPALLRNMQHSGNHAVSDAKIEGARWVSGRWPGKQALLFDTEQEFAELDVAGEFAEFTIATWVFVDRLDNPLNALFNSNGWESGAIHFQLNRSGSPYTDIHEILDRKRRAMDVIPMGKWVHLAATFSASESATRVYVDGRLAYEAAMHEDERIRPGTCRIGNWLAAGKFVPVRSLHGRIDELALWNRALSVKAIEAEVTRGQPSH